ncbi:hypothetical protein [Alistipes sp.]|uniref:hypothetical protein n=2 Tax=Alistipes sp. TaxID=1872444 RepID=UPI0025B7F954|nr:hypothetical protein [Alistipes sp.]MCI7141330.1 hypothetical protein [Alistipes sp.]MDY5397243.1 hypothetical protein [Alistipes sp.]
MKKRAIIMAVATVCLLFGARRAVAQYYTWGADAPMKWSTIRTSDVRMIYPDTAASLAARTLYYIRTVQPSIGYGFRYGPMRIPFVMHPENFQSNGLVMYLPKRVEFLTSPAIDSYSMPWYKQLVAHEYRHAVQYNNLNRGLIRVLSYLTGEQGSTVGLLFMPLWALEGDAVMSETMMSSYGRGLQPSFTMGYRAMGRVGRNRRDTRDRRNPDKWFCGSYRDHIPDHYELGYQLCSYAYDRYGENIWDKVVRYSVRNPYVILTTHFGLRKYYDTSVGQLFRETFDDLQRFWDSLPRTGDSAATLTPLPAGNHTTYEWPLALGDTAVLAVKSDLGRPSRFVRIDRRTGREQEICHTGLISTRPTMSRGRVWWTEYRRSLLFEQRVNSRLCFMDLADGRPRTAPGHFKTLYPTATPESLGWVEYAPDGRYTVIEQRDEAPEARYEVPADKEVHGLAWDDLTRAWYVLLTDDSGMWIARIDVEGLHPVTRGAYITLSDLRAGGGMLYYGSIASGKDEVHGYDLVARREFRLSVSEYGSFDPAPAGRELLLTTYDRLGYRVTHQPSDSLRIPVAPAALPVDWVNPPRRRWEVPNLDTVRFTARDAVEQREQFREKRYRKVPNLVNVHSWMPLAFNPFSAVNEHVIDVNAGFTIMSQNLLSSVEAYASYGWNRSEGSVLNLGVRYFGLGLRFDLDASYGGNQIFYSLVSYDPETGNPLYQSQPAPEKYYSVGLTTTLPLVFQRGYHTRQLSLSAGWNYSNGMVADLNKIEWENGNIHNIERVGFNEGLHKLSFGAGFSDQVRLAHRDFAPRWGYSLSASYTFDPLNADFSNLISFYGQGYLPGFVRHHSLHLEATFQTSVGGYKFPAGYAPLSYKSTQLIPHGFTSSEIVSNSYTALSLDYQLPLCYPEGGITSILYIKRIRLNLGGDYAQFRRPAGAGLEWRRIGSFGGDLLFDFNLFRQPASATSTLKLSCYHPSSGGVWIAASVGLPF